MANTRQIKRRINSAQNISKITKAMEMVAASKMKRAQDQALESRDYTQALVRSLQKVAHATDESLHPLLSHHEEGLSILVIVSTDKGLCGSLNTNIFKSVLEWKHTHPNGKYIVVGRKAVMFARLAKLELLAQFTDLPEKASVEDILPLSNLIQKGFTSHEFKKIDVVFTDFINTLSQQTTRSKLLPLEPEAYEDETMVVPHIASEYTFEPNARTLLDQLLPYYVENALFQTLLEARASEHSARMVAMKNASENAGELMDELKLIYNKSRQTAITSEILDITTAQMSLS